MLPLSISCYNQIWLNIEYDNNTTFKDCFIFWLLIETCCRILMKSYLIILKFGELFSKKRYLGIEKSFLYGVGVKFWTKKKWLCSICQMFKNSRLWGDIGCHYNCTSLYEIYTKYYFFTIPTTYAIVWNFILWAYIKTPL